MLLIKSKYKLAKRLGAGIFEKTQTQKFALSEARSQKKIGTKRGGSDYGKQLKEKQRVRFTYGIAEGQLRRYAAQASETKNPSERLNQLLEMRVDNAIYRAGFAATRRAARQIVSHGHITINGVRTTVPSHQIRVGDMLKVREGSRSSVLFSGLVDADTKPSVPQWISADAGTLQAEITGLPQYDKIAAGLDYPSVFEFYNR